MTGYEILYGGLNLLIIVVTAVKLLLAPNRMLFWSPLLFYTFTWGYYSVIGPAVTLLSGDIFDRGRDMRPSLEMAMLGGLVSYIVTLLGYRFGRGHSTQTSTPLRLNTLWASPMLGKNLTVWGVVLMVTGLGMFTFAVGRDILGMLNPFAVRSAGAGYSGAFYNYFMLGIQLFIPGCILLLLGARRYAPARYPLLGAIMLTVVLYLQQGFRYRLVLLVGGLLLAYYLDRWKRPNVLVQTVCLACTVLIMGFIGVTRDYGMGLRLDRLEGENITRILQGGLGDSSIFFTSGAVLETVPKELPYAWWAPIKGALLMPIPRAIYDDKDTFGYSELLLGYIYGRDTQTGAAYMFFAEWYYAFGWAGLIAASLLLGFLMGRVWRWFLAHSDNLFAIALYACLMPFSYVILSRGYFSQVVMLLCFAALPAYALYRFNLRRINGSTSAPRVTSDGQVVQLRPPAGPREGHRPSISQ